jgi:hypothetical protein
VAIIRRGLAKAGNKEVVVRIFPNADHSLWRTKTGGPREARERSRDREGKSGPDFVDGYLETMTTWLDGQCGR